MGKVDDQIRNEFEKFSRQFGPETIVPAQVMSYNASDETIEVKLTGGAVIDDVRLKSMVKAGNKLVVVPETGSFVLIGKISNSDEYVLISADAISKINWKIGNVQLNVDEDGFELKKGTDSLQKVLSDIIAEVNKIVVMIGTSPNVANLTAIDTRLKQFLK